MQPIAKIDIVDVPSSGEAGPYLKLHVLTGERSFIVHCQPNDLAKTLSDTASVIKQFARIAA